MNKIMKLNIITKYFYPVTAGIENNIFNTYSNFSKKKWNIKIHTSRDTYLKKNKLREKEHLSGLSIKRYKWNRLFGFWPEINWNEKQIIALHNFNVFPHLPVMFFTFILKMLKRKNFKLFLIPHGGFSPEWTTFPAEVRFVKRAYHHFLAPLIINNSVDGIRAVAHWEKREMITAGINQELIKIITNGVEKEAYLDIDKLSSEEIKNKVKSYGKYVIQVGRISKIKNQEVAIRSTKYLKGIKLVIVGPSQDKEYKNKLIKLVKKTGLEDRIVFAGVIRGVDKYYLMKNAMAMVHMALWEGNCNVIHEAWSQNLICIAADSKGLNEQIKNGENGFLVNKYDYQKLARRIGYVIRKHNGEKLIDMRKRNLQYVKNNSWKKVSERVSKFYLNTYVN